MKLSFIATYDAIFTVLETWPSEWHALDLAELEKVVAQKMKDDVKLRVTQLAEKRQQETQQLRKRQRGKRHRKPQNRKRLQKQ